MNSLEFQGTMQFSDVIELGNSSRTEDVRSAALFQSLMISPAIVTKMASHGFKYPSPVQEKAIPTALSGFGRKFSLFLDIFVQISSFRPNPAPGKLWSFLLWQLKI